MTSPHTKLGRSAPRRSRWPLVPVLLVGVGLGAFLEHARATTKPPSSAAPASYSRFQKIDLFAKVLAIIEQQYVRPVDDTALVYSAIDGLVSELDPHSGFLDPREAELLREDIGGRFGGVGLVVVLRRDEQATPPVFLEVRDVIAGGPAAVAGIEKGDRIVSIEDQAIAQFVRLEDAIGRMRGAVGTPVAFRYVRGDAAPRDIELIRGEVDPPAIEARYLGDGLAVIQLGAFQEDCAREVDEAIRRLGAENGGALKGIVLDMRDNGGGLLSEAVRLANLFLSRGVIVRTRARGERLVDEIAARRPGTWRDLAVVVLINKGSASATEIVAGALQDHRRALIVGERSYGKGSVQSPYTLDDGSMLKLTTALYYTPHDRLIQAAGITPDVRVGSEAVEYADTRPELVPERDVDRHLRPEDFDRTPSHFTELSPAVQAAGDDIQLRAAVEHVRALAVVQSPGSSARKRP